MRNSLTPKAWREQYNVISNKLYNKVNIVDLDTNNNSVFKLSYNLVLVIKYRRTVIDDDISKKT